MLKLGLMVWLRGRRIRLDSRWSRDSWLLCGVVRQCTVLTALTVLAWWRDGMDPGRTACSYDGRLSENIYHYNVLQVQERVLKSAQPT